MITVDKFTLKSFVVITSWLFLLGFIAYSIRTYSDLIREVFPQVFTVFLTLINIAIAKWLFEMER